MIALFFAQRVILKKIEFKDLPSTLKDSVRTILRNDGFEELCAE